MILLYIDESGDFRNPDDHFVVGGVAIHEFDVRPMNRSIDAIARRRLAPHLRGLEFHAQEIRSGKGPWGRIPRPVKQGILSDMPRLIGTFGNQPGYGLFAVARAPQAVPAADPFERTFEELLLRFTQMLIRMKGDGMITLVWS